KLPSESRMHQLDHVWLDVSKKLASTLHFTNRAGAAAIDRQRGLMHSCVSACNNVSQCV
ncbi:hypothetical protein A2U01_0045243, partial [Trifolium medium]|nr:hypothetical protein [Trifolium medium]